MATVQREFVEKPPHIDERRMRHISDADLFAAVNLARPGLGDVREAAERGDWDGAYAAWAAYFAGRDRPVPSINTAGFGRFLREQNPERAAATIAEATALHTIAVDYTDRTMGKSRLYGFHYFGWLAPLIDAYAIDGDERHAAAFARLFNQWYETRDDVHGEWQMDVIWYSLGLSIRTPIFSLAYRTFRNSPSLDGRTQARLLKTVLGAARWLAEEHDAFRYGNWQHHGVTGLFDLATFWPEFREAPAWAELAWERLLEHLELDVYPDGGHFERAPTYHTGVMSGYRRVADAAELNWHARLQDHPRFLAMYRCLLEQCTPLGTSLNFNDSGLAGVAPHMVQGAVLFADPEFKWLAEHFSTPLETAAILAALPDRADGRTAAQAYADLPSRSPAFASTLLPTSKFAIMRGGWERDDLFLAINYGPYVEHELESHSHFDALSFTAFGFGEPLAIEAGKPINYDDPLYYDWYRVARAHNVVTVDGVDPAPEGKDGDLLMWSTSPVADLFQARHDGYRPTMGVGHRRTILFVRNSCFVVHDELDQDGRTSHEFAWHLHMPGEFGLVDGAARPESGPGLLAMPVSLGAPGALGADQRAEVVEGTMVVPRFAPNDGSDDRRAVRGVRYVQDSAARQVTFFTVLAPVRHEADAARIAVSAIPIDGGDGEACSIVTPEGEDLVAIAGGLEAGVRRAGAWSSDGRVWLVRSSGAWAAYAVSELHRDDTTIFRSTSPVESVAVWPADDGWAGEIVALRKTGVRFRIGTVSRVTLNGVVVPREGDGEAASFELPAAGRYAFALGR